MSSESFSLHKAVKSYRIYRRPSDRLREILMNVKRHRDFRALGPVSLTVQKGEIIGVLGKNGSGKSTLLQLIAGTLNPTEGIVRSEKRVCALADIGALFNPQLTGTENVEYFARVLGMSRETIAGRMEEIRNFADIGDFMDSPVRTYSAGMRLRVAFAAALSVDADLYLLDEVLSVGDAAFQRKCLEKMRALMKSRQKTFVLVSHALDPVNTFCSRAIILDRGALVFDGPAKEATNLYHALCFTGPTVNRAAAGEGSLTSEFRHGTGEALIEAMEILNETGNPCNSIETNKPFTLRLRVTASRAVEKPIYGIRLRAKSGINVYARSTIHDPGVRVPPLIPQKKQTVDFAMTASLLAGDFFFTANIVELEASGERRMLDARMDAVMLTVTGGIGNQGIANLNGRIIFSQDQP